MGIGVYSDLDLREAIEKGSISSKKKIREEQVQPSSIDLRLGSRVYYMPFSSVSFRGDIEEFLRERNKHNFRLDKNGSFLHKNKVYVIELQEGLELPEYLFGRINPKSSIGRTDIHVRGITQEGGSFDCVRPGYKGRLFLEFYSRSFDVIVREGISLNQLRLGELETRTVLGEELTGLHRDSGLIGAFDNKGALKRRDLESFRALLGPDRLYMTLALDKSNPGYFARKNAPPVDLSRTDHSASDYFEKIAVRKDGTLIVDSDSFYILSSAEVIRVPEDFCAEMLDVETNSGEFRSHYAGFFDPGFEAQATLEMRNYGTSFLMREGDRIASLKYFPLKSPPKEVYGSGKGSNYQGQRGPKLAKFFDMGK
jgi:dCTP deaminase